MSLLNILKEYLEYEHENLSGSSKREYKAKIRAYLELHRNETITELLSETNLWSYISLNKNPIGAYHALLSLYKFIEIIKNGKKENRVIFPIDLKDIEDLRETDENTDIGPVFIEKNQSLDVLFDDRYYKNIFSKVAVTTVKAIFSLAISAGYDSGEFFNKNNKQKKPIFKLDDIRILTDAVEVRNTTERTTVPWITIKGKSAIYLNDYYSLRITNKGEDDSFFIKMYDIKDIVTEDVILYGKPNRRPYSLQILALNVLKTISLAIGLEKPLNITHLRYNMVLHSLLESKGSSLANIIEVFGYPRFVQDSFNKYCEIINNSTYFAFDPFFQEASLEENKEPAGEAESGFRQKVIYERLKDSQKARGLKQKYDNKCQICGDSITMIDDIYYSEACHIQPHGKAHMGPDETYNMLIMCPNHHTLFDLGIFTIDPEDMVTIMHIDPDNKLNGEKLVLNLHELSTACLRYHYKNIYLDLLYKIQQERAPEFGEHNR